MNGIICIDKPQGCTSFDIVAKLRRICNERHVGHAGTLDPMATGVLPVFFGEATKVISLLPCQDKRYTAGIRLGITSDTGDITGKLSTTADAGTVASIEEKEVEAAVLSFRGEIEQVPPMYSAIKSGGRHLYEIAREGREIERAARKITVYDIGYIGIDKTSGDYIVDVSCSKGTYIRTLVEDIGRKLGCGACMSSLRRTFAAGFDLKQCATLEEVKLLSETDKLQQITLDVENVFRGLPQIEITKKQMIRFRNGGALAFDRLNNPPENGLCRVRCDGLFIGIGEAEKNEEQTQMQIKIKCHFNRDISQ